MAGSRSEEVKVLSGWTNLFVMRPRIALNINSVEYDFLEETFRSKSDFLLKSNPIYKKILVMIQALSRHSSITILSLNNSSISTRRSGKSENQERDGIFLRVPYVIQSKSSSAILMHEMSQRGLFCSRRDFWDIVKAVVEAEHNFSEWNLKKTQMELDFRRKLRKVVDGISAFENRKVSGGEHSKGSIKFGSRHFSVIPTV
ncbi:hypothetical protein MKW98_028672, partial [Papaver atlanticum]